MFYHYFASPGYVYIFRFDFIFPKFLLPELLQCDDFAYSLAGQLAMRIYVAR